MRHSIIVPLFACGGPIGEDFLLWFGMRLTAIVWLALNPLLIAPLLDRRRFLVHGTLAVACEFVAGLFLWHPEAFESFAAALLCALALPIVIAGNFWWLLKVRSNAYYHWRHGTSEHRNCA